MKIKKSTIKKAFARFVNFSTLTAGLLICLVAGKVAILDNDPVTGILLALVAGVLFAIEVEA